MSKRILVTLDGSERSETVLSSLPSILCGEDELMLLSVGRPPRSTIGRPARPAAAAAVGTGFALRRPEPPSYAELQEQATQRVRAELIDYLELKAAFLREEGFRVRTEALLSEEPARAIIEFAQAYEPTAIAMTTHGRSGLSELIHGSVTGEVVRSGVAPVLLVRPKL